MFDFDVSKLILVGVIALVLVGPKDLPRALRAVGQAVGRARRIRSDFHKAITDLAAIADVDGIGKELASVENYARVNIALNPATAMRGSLPLSSAASIAPIEREDDASRYASAEMKAYLAPTPEPVSVTHVDGGPPTAGPLN